MLDNSVKDIKERQRAYENLIEELGRKLMSILFATIKVAAMYEANNNRYIEQAAKLRETLTKIFADEPDFTLTAKGGYLFISEVRLKAEYDTEAAMAYFLERFPALGISGFSFRNDLDPRELDKFIFLLSGFECAEDPGENFDNLRERLNQLKVERIVPVRISEKEDVRPSEEEADKNSTRASARKAFFNAIGVVQDTINQARNNNTVNVARTKRVVQQLINHIIEDESSLVELVSLRNFDDYTYVHSVNVCVLSLVLGYHLGLDRRRLSNLGVGALLHDIGKTRLPLELVNKPDVFDEYDWQQMRKHPVFGVKALLRTRVADETAARAAAAVFEHHLSMDGSGYPETLGKRKPTMFARIVAIADSYNAMTSGRVYHTKRHPPDEAITSMVHRVGRAFDPLLLKVFINTMGIYPVGTVVALSSKEIAIVARINPDDFEKPQVKVIANEDGPYDINEVKVIDLSKEPSVRVTKVIDGDKYNIDIANYLDVG